MRASQKADTYNEDGEDRGEQEGMRLGKAAGGPAGRRAARSRTARERAGRSPLHRRDKPVSAARQRFNVARHLGGVAERLAKARNRIVQAMVEIDERVGGPNLRAQLLASDHIAGAR